MVVPVVFILMLPIAFAASVKNDDHVDNSFSFTYDAETDDMVVATSSKRFSFDDDVDFSVSVAETNDATTPLVGRVRFGLLAKRGVRYTGTITFRLVDATGNVAYETTEPVSFTLRPRKGQRVETVTFPFDVASGDYTVDVSFSR